ncbi:MAG: chemotaxis protein CheA [Rhodobacteraceae bacterium]|nr:MAG: chemotaxis protein CheA [Paracoccaceae bacterium]
MSSDSLKATFFAECEDLLDALSAGLGAMADGSADGETVNAIFRAVHSIKGAAGAFALTDLVGFAHKFETVLDLIRSDTLTVDADVLRVITRSGDVLADLVEAAQTESGEIPEAMDALVQSLVTIAQDAVPAAGAAATMDFAPLAFVPLDIGPISVPSSRFAIAFRPERGLFDNGHEPLHLIDALRALGDLKVECDVSAVPPLDQFDPENSYLSWTMELVGPVSEGEVRRIFDFVLGLCDLKIDRLDDASVEDDLPLAEAGQEEATAIGEPAMTGEDRGQGLAPDAPASGKQPRAASAVAAAPPTTLRVDPERVDRLINTVGELIINQAVIAQKMRAMGIPPNAEVIGDLDDYRYLAREIQEGVMAIRAQPVKPLFQRMARIVREAGEATGKTVALVTEGEGTEVDKTLVERLADPLTHMIRNAVDHGIETPEKRLAAGKSATGTVKLSAAHRSGHVEIVITDDGAGLNRERILATAQRKGLVPPDAKLSEAEIDNLLFMPGFSTASTVTNLSGRGVGMDVVKTTITSLGGRVTISSQPGQGSVFTILLPLTLAVLDGMVVTVASETMVLPLSSIVETIRAKPSDFAPIGPNGMLMSVRGSHVPVLSLGGVLGLSDHDFDCERAVFVLIQTDSSEPVALAVDHITDQRQVVIKSLEGNYGSIPGVSAATILGDGKIALIVDTEAVLKMAAPKRSNLHALALETSHDRIAHLG